MTRTYQVDDTYQEYGIGTEKECDICGHYKDDTKADKENITRCAECRERMRARQ